LKVEVTHPARSAGKNVFVVCLHFFGSTSTISRFGERFRDGQYSLASLLFAVLLLMVSPCQPFVKVGERAPCPMASAPLDYDYDYYCSNRFIVTSVASVADI